MDMLAKALKDGDIKASERNWLEFILELMRWHHRSDIIVEESSIDIGEFDIEIESV
jgi:hypothetical protein